MLNDLKPCPFCGVTPKFWYEKDGGCCVRCVGCKSKMFATTPFLETEEEAADIWNRRADNA